MMGDEKFENTLLLSEIGKLEKTRHHTTTPLSLHHFVYFVGWFSIHATYTPDSLTLFADYGADGLILLAA